MPIKSPKRPSTHPGPPPKKYGKEAQKPDPPDDSPLATEDEHKYVQRVVGSILYYARAVDITALLSLSALAAEQAKATKGTLKGQKIC